MPDQGRESTAPIAQSGRGPESTVSGQTPQPGPDRTRPVDPSAVHPFAARPVAVIAAVVAAVHLSVATRYGWHRDEFYYVLCGRHPAFGYVDQPPLTPLIARAATAFGGGLLPLRVAALLFQLACVVLIALIAREFGGGRRAQTWAAAASAACPIFLGASLLFGTTVTGQAFELALLVLVLRALRVGGVRAWLAAGLVLGAGLENKDTIAVLAAGIGVGLAVSRREVLRTPGPWLAGGLAVLLALPNLVWDARNGWPNFAMTSAIGRRQGGPVGGLVQLVLLAVLLAGPPLVALWVTGVRWLRTSDQARARGHRWLLPTTLVTVLAFAVEGGKDYYAASLLAVLFAAGAVRIESSGRGLRIWRALVAAAAVSSVVLTLPVLPVAAANALRPVDVEPMETYGWPLFARQVADAAKQAPPGTPILTANYGEAGALLHYGPAAGLTGPVVSGQNNFSLWGPPAGTTPATVVCLSDPRDLDHLTRAWSSVTPIAKFTLPNGLQDRETDNHTTIYLCRQPRGTWDEIWPSLRHYD